jgi:hypothetical protein
MSAVLKRSSAYRILLLTVFSAVPVTSAISLNGKLATSRSKNTSLFVGKRFDGEAIDRRIQVHSAAPIDLSLRTGVGNDLEERPCSFAFGGRPVERRMAA